MSTKRIPLIEASATQLADFGRAALNLDVNFRMGADKIRAVMATGGYDKDYIEVEVSDGPDPNARPAGAEAEAPRKMVVINIPNQDIPGSTEGKQPVPVGVNGKVYLIKRGVDVEVPIEVVGVLNDAKRVVYDRGPNGEPINPTFVPTHPFTIVRSAA